VWKRAQGHVVHDRQADARSKCVRCENAGQL